MTELHFEVSKKTVCCKNAPHHTDGLDLFTVVFLYMLTVQSWPKSSVSGYAAIHVLSPRYHAWIMHRYDELFLQLDFTLPRAATGRKGFPKEAMLCAFIVMKCEGFSQISDLVDFLNCNLLITYSCGFDITKPLPSYRSLKSLRRSAA